jgi:tRNA A37 threonylcarbamoyladenosine dehydratase
MKLWVGFVLGPLICAAQVTSFVGEFRLKRTGPIARSSRLFQLPSVEEEVSSDLSIEQRNLRFAGVGRLYTSPSKGEISPDIEPHLQLVERLAKATVVVVGLGGVGSWAAEALCRSGIGNIIMIDLDDICISNTNRQLHALSSTVGKMKIDEMERRLRDINPDCNVTLIHDFVSPDNADDIFTRIPGITACLDAIDGANGKSAIIAASARYGIPIVTCGGSAGRTDPTKFVCDDLTRANGDRLLGACRKILRKQYGFEEGKSFRESLKKRTKKWKIKAVYSLEPQKELSQGSDASSFRRCDGALGTACFVTGTAGFVAAGQVIDMIANDDLLAPRNFRGNKPPITS